MNAVMNLRVLSKLVRMYECTYVCMYVCMYVSIDRLVSFIYMLYFSVSQRPGRGPVPGPGINYTGPREVLLEFVILVS